MYLCLGFSRLIRGKLSKDEIDTGGYLMGLRSRIVFRKSLVILLPQMGFCVSRKNPINMRK